MSVRYDKSSDSIDVASKSNFKFTLHKVPEFDCSITGPRTKESVLGVNCKTPDPACMSTNDRL